MPGPCPAAAVRTLSPPPRRPKQAEAAQIKARVNAIGGASHVALISHPAEVANSILNAVGSVGGL